MKNNLQKILLIILGLMITILVCLGIGKIFYQENNDIDNSINEDVEDIEANDNSILEDLDYSINGDYVAKNDEKNNAVIIYRYDKVLKKYVESSKYYCKNQKCIIDDLNLISKSVFIIQDGGADLENVKYLLVSYSDGILFETNDRDNIFTLGTNETLKYYVLKGDNGKSSLIDQEGKMIINNLYEDIGKYKDMYCDWCNTTFSIKKDYTTYKNNNKYGILKISDGSVVVDAKYDALEFISINESNENLEYYKIYQNGKWYLYDINTFTSVNNIGYDEIFYAHNNLMIVDIDNKVYFKDLKGNNIINQYLNLYISKNEIKNYLSNHTYYYSYNPIYQLDARLNENIITISILTNVNNFFEDAWKPTLYKKEFEYNMATKELKEIQVEDFE